MGASDLGRTSTAFAIAAAMATVTVVAAGGLDLREDVGAAPLPVETTIQTPTTVRPPDPVTVPGSAAPSQAVGEALPPSEHLVPTATVSSPGLEEATAQDLATADPLAWLERVGTIGTTFIGSSNEAGSLDLVRDFDVAAGRQSDVFMISRSWADATADIATVDAIARAGYFPVVAWEPWDHRVESTFDRRRGEQPGFALGTIIAGEHDALIESWAVAAASWGHPMAIRFAHEMNGWWYPWSESSNGNVDGQYVAAWRHVHDIFTEAGAHNVVWIWSPNPTQPTLTPLNRLYPGDDYVDWLGVVGYLGNGIDPSVYVPTFDQLFGPTIDELRSLSELPIVITEIGATEEGGRKADWIRHVVTEIAADDDIVGFIWFEVDKETDWRVVSSDEARRAFAAAVDDPRLGVPRE